MPHVLSFLAQRVSSTPIVVGNYRRSLTPNRLSGPIFLNIKAFFFLIFIRFKATQSGEQPLHGSILQSVECPNIEKKHKHFELRTK